MPVAAFREAAGLVGLEAIGWATIGGTVQLYRRHTYNHRPRDDIHALSTCVTLNCTDHDYNLKYLIIVLTARAIC